MHAFPLVVATMNNLPFLLPVEGKGEVRMLTLHLFAVKFTYIYAIFISKYFQLLLLQESLSIQTDEFHSIA